jgi:phosphatidylserine/phosphatidylglycerophosphate/cardiolipin synthase-like enzyme
VDVRGAEFLHAKIYLNEREVLVSSMNLHQFSANNSLEIGLLVKDKEAESQVRRYVTQTLMGRAVRISIETAGPARTPANNSARPVQSAAVGYCIRCSSPIALNPSKPLCSAHYEVWAAWGNEDYEEEFCHACGRPWETSYAKPLCRSCYQRHR